MITKFMQFFLIFNFDFLVPGKSHKNQYKPV